MAKPNIHGRNIRATTCCGLYEMSGLSVDPVHTNSWENAGGITSFSEFKKTLRGRACFATTVNHQKNEAEALEANGFAKVGKWRNGNTGRMVTLWFYNPTKKKGKK